MIRLTDAVFAGIVLLSAGCSDDSNVESPRDGGADTGTLDGSQSARDAEAMDASYPEDAAALDAAFADATFMDATVDAATDATADAAADAAEDAAIDATIDAGPAPRFVYVMLNQRFVRVDLSTGAHDEIAMMDYTFLSLAWDSVAGVARVIYDIEAPSTGNAKLGTIDLCTGAITEGAALNIAGTPVRYAEGLAQHPTTGAFWVSYPTVGAGNQYAANRVGTVDIATGAITFVGTIASSQNDADSIAFIGDVLHIMDVVRPSTTQIRRAIPPTTGTAMTMETVVNAATDAITRISYDAANDELIVANSATGLTDRHIAVMDRTTGATTRLTPALPSDQYAGAFYYSLLVAPQPACL